MRIDRTTTLILKGGGIKGLAFAGALEQLEDAGFAFKTYVGTSAGAVATVLLAAGHSGRSLSTLLENTDFAAFQDAGRFRRVVNFVFRGGLYPGDRLKKWVEARVREQSVLADQTRYPLVQMKHLSLKESRAIVFASHTLVGTITFDSQGENADTDVSHAVRLSCSIPGFFIPGDHQGHRVYDGGLLHNFPIEVYQRVRGTPSVDGDEDFLALYLGRTPAQDVRTGWRNWWVFEMLEIMLARDDTIVLTKHIDRTVVIDTDPVDTTDFTLSQAEKALLVHRGRLAALTFLQRQVDENGLCGTLSGQEIDERLAREREAARDLNHRVGVTRRKRRLVGWSRRAAAACLMVAAVTGATLSVPKWFPPEFRIDDSVGYVRNYLDERGVANTLADDAIGEISEIYARFPAELTDNSLQFDRVTQLILHYTNEEDHSISAVKVVLMEGVVDLTSNRVLIKLFGSVPSNDLKISGLVMAEEEDGWKYKPTEFITPLSKSAVQERHLNVRTDLPSIRDKRIRVVSVISYNGLFRTKDGLSLNAIPWIMNVHRFLAPDGEATYAFMSDEKGSVRIPQHLYTKTEQEVFRRVVRPTELLDNSEMWSRLQAVSEVMSTTSLREQLKPEQLLVVNRVMKRLEVARAEAFRGTFEFTFDRRNTWRMNPDPSKLNLLVFAEKPPAAVPSLSADTSDTPAKRMASVSSTTQSMATSPHRAVGSTGH